MRSCFVELAFSLMTPQISSLLWVKSWKFVTCSSIASSGGSLLLPEIQETACLRRFSIAFGWGWGRVPQLRACVYRKRGTPQGQCHVTSRAWFRAMEKPVKKPQTRKTREGRGREFSGILPPKGLRKTLPIGIRIAVYSHNSTELKHCWENDDLTPGGEMTRCLPWKRGVRSQASTWKYAGYDVSCS